MKMTDEILGEMNVDGGDIEGQVEINGQKIYFGIIMAASTLLEQFWKFLQKRLRLPKGGWMTPVRLVRTWMLILTAQ